MAISKIGSKALVDCSVAAVDIADGSITNAKLAGSIDNAKLANSSITVNGTSITLGASADLKAIDWQAVVTTNTTMVAGRGYFVNTTSGAITMTLPASASAGDTIAIKDYAATFNTNNLTIGRNGHNIQGAANDSLISTNRASLTLVYVDATKGWLYAVESNVADLQTPLFLEATGGTVTTSGNYKIHSFTGDGCFVVSQIGNGSSVPTGGPAVVDYIVVAGGGGGGLSGAGAGGFRESHSVPVSGCYTASPLATPTGITVTAISYPITVGGGGAGGTNCGAGSQGNNSIFSTITSAGGARGTGVNSAGIAGGSGSGGGGCNGSSPLGGAGNTPPVSPPQGNPGGQSGPGASTYSAGGGGGATEAGQNAPSNTQSGRGGAGATTSISASPTAYAGGGGGSGWSATGGGGAGSPCGTGGAAGDQSTSGSPGTVNRGGGGGAGGNSSGTNGSGGKGIVIIRYKYQ